MVWATGNAHASYSIDNISLKFDVIKQIELARQIHNQYAGRLAILYDRIAWHGKILKTKTKKNTQERYHVEHHH